MRRAERRKMTEGLEDGEKKEEEVGRGKEQRRRNKKEGV